MNYLIKKYQRTLEAAGLKKYRFHDLRHYSASFQIALGIPPQYIMERGGWETDGSMKRYIHALDQKRKEFSEKTNDAFDKILKA
jgi:integrase